MIPTPTEKMCVSWQGAYQSVDSGGGHTTAKRGGRVGAAGGHARDLEGRGPPLRPEESSAQPVLPTRPAGLRSLGRSLPSHGAS